MRQTFFFDLSITIIIHDKHYGKHFPDQKITRDICCDARFVTVGFFTDARGGVCCRPCCCGAGCFCGGDGCVSAGGACAASCSDANALSSAAANESGSVNNATVGSVPGLSVNECEGTETPAADVYATCSSSADPTSSCTEGAAPADGTQLSTVRIASGEVGTSCICILS